MRSTFLPGMSGPVHSGDPGGTKAPRLRGGHMSGLSLILLIAACTPALPEVTDEGLHVRVAADSGLRLCAGTLAHIDEFVERVSEQFGEAPPVEEERITFYWLDADGFYERSGCSSPALGCEKDGILWAKEAPIDHEFVHAIVHKISHPSPFFIEGLADAYNGLGAIRKAATVFTYRARRTVLAGRYRSVDYGAAGAFTAYLVVRHGIDAYLTAYASWPTEPNERAIDDVFLDVFGVSLSQSLTDFEATYAACSRAEVDAKLLECSAAEIAWDGSSLIANHTLSCEQEDAIGPFGGEDIVVQKTLVVPRDGMYEIGIFEEEATGLGEPSSSISLVPCGPCGSGSSVTANAGEPVQTAALRAGRHSLRLHGSSKELIEVRYHVKAVNAGDMVSQATEVVPHVDRGRSESPTPRAPPSPRRRLP